MSSPDDSSLLYKFLFHLRGSLYSIENPSRMAKSHPEKMPISVLNWFEKWMPLVEKWIFDEQQSHSLFHDGKEHNWEQILHDMAENMKDISIAYAEAKRFEIPEAGEDGWLFLIKWVIESVIRGCEDLDKEIRSVLNKDYQ